MQNPPRWGPSERDGETWDILILIMGRSITIVKVVHPDSCPGLELASEWAKTNQEPARTEQMAPSRELVKQRVRATTTNIWDDEWRACKKREQNQKLLSHRTLFHPYHPPDADLGGDASHHWPFPASLTQTQNWQTVIAGLRMWCNSGDGGPLPF